MSKPPIFIHSLFRSGSTYIFEVFRRSNADYWCYQEPLHEATVFLRDNPEDLIATFGAFEATANRHPELDKPYFLELFEAWPAWKDKIHEKFVYGTYFSEEKTEFGLEFWQSLIEASKGRPVFQECRTSGRIKAIKNYIEGFHVFLWRNPWDQWWSYKINAYFNTANQLIVHANNAPAPIKSMLKDLSLPRCEGNDLGKAFSFYNDRPLTSEQSYLVFYMLWCLSIKEGLEHADLMANIDRLSESVEYQDQILERLMQAGIEGVSLSDCRVPQGVYSETDAVFFNAAEARVHLWLIQGGWQHRDITVIQMLRDQFSPISRSIPIAKQDPQRLVEQLERFKEMAKRFETSFAENQKASLSKLQETATKMEHAEARARKAEELTQHAEARASKAEELTQHAEARASKAEILRQETNEKLDSMSRELEISNQELRRVHQANHQHWQLAEQRWHELHAIYNSKSWRITAPLRWPVHQFKLLRQHGLKKRLKAFVKKVLRKFNQYLLTRPKLRHRLLRLSQSVGTYRVTRRLLDRIREEPCSGGCLQDSTDGAYPISPEQMTPRAQQIYKELKRDINELEKGGD